MLFKKIDKLTFYKTIVTLISYHISIMDKIFDSIHNYENSIVLFKTTFNKYIIDVIKSIWLPSDRMDIFYVDNLDKIIVESNYFEPYKSIKIIISPFLIYSKTENETFDMSPLYYDANPTLTQDFKMYVKSSITDLTDEEKNKINIIGLSINICIDNIDECHMETLFN